MRLAIAQIAMVLGALSAFGGAVMFVIGLFRATVGANEGGAMQARAGIMLLVVAAVVFGVGLLLRPRRSMTPPNQTRA